MRAAIFLEKRRKLMEAWAPARRKPDTAKVIPIKGRIV